MARPLSYIDLLVPWTEQYYALFKIWEARVLPPGFADSVDQATSFDPDPVIFPLPDVLLIICYIINSWPLLPSVRKAALRRTVSELIHLFGTATTPEELRNDYLEAHNSFQIRGNPRRAAEDRWTMETAPRTPVILARVFRLLTKTTLPIPAER